MSEPDEPRGRGRPSEYREDFAEQALKLCKLGATDAQIAEFFDKGEATINRWKDEHPEFGEALRLGKLGPDAEVAASLYQRANWHEFTEQQAIKVRNGKGPNGEDLGERVEVIDVKRVLPPCSTAMIFWLKNRQPERWRDRQEVDHSLTAGLAEALEKARRRARKNHEPGSDEPSDSERARPI